MRIRNYGLLITNISHCAGGFLFVLAVSQNRRVNVSHKLAKLGFEKPKAAM